MGLFTLGWFGHSAYVLAIQGEEVFRNTSSEIGFNYLFSGLALGTIYTAGATVLHKAVKPVAKSILRL